MTLLRCENVRIHYDNQPAVSDVSFSVEDGDMLYVLGENGSGKTTLMKGILGLMHLTGGKIRYEGLRKKEIGYLPQQTVVQRDFPASVYEIALSGCLNRTGLRPFYTERDKQRARDQLTKLGIADLTRTSYRELSGGQQQRVLLARALCAAEKLLILDEPVAGLDPVASAEFYALVERLNLEQNMTVIMISHDIGSAVRYAHKILHMDTGLLFFGPKSDYLQTDLYETMRGGRDHASDDH